MTQPEPGSDVTVGGEQGPGGYIFPAVVPLSRTLLVSCNVVAISTKSIISVGESCRLVLHESKIIRNCSDRPASIRTRFHHKPLRHCQPVGDWFSPLAYPFVLLADC